jgi:putative SOS response-associated peptidase YedK
VCGRYVLATDPAALIEEFDIVKPSERILEPDYNVAPTKDVYIVVDEQSERSLDVARWGLVPSWAKDPAIGSRMINARVETIDTKPAYRSSTKKRRCIIPADGYYEWYTPAIKARKQPFYIHSTDGHPLAFAGLYAWWRAAEDAPWLLTCTIITTDATDALGQIHDRAPMYVPRDAWGAWLDAQTPGDPRTLLSPHAPVQATAVSTRVNNVRNNGPDLIAPLAAEGDVDSGNI